MRQIAVVEAQQGLPELLNADEAGNRLRSGRRTAGLTDWPRAGLGHSHRGTQGR
jgi:hypothetical protein